MALVSGANRMRKGAHLLAELCRNSRHIHAAEEEGEMNTSMRFLINAPKVILETFDDEVVIVNLDSGNYYSLDKVGADIWGLLESGASLQETVSAIAGSYNGDHDDMKAGINRLVEELQEENLIVIDTSETSSGSRVAPLTEYGFRGEKPAFTTPLLSKYTDMQDLLLLDPIHEVDDSGWPNSKSESPAEK